MEPATFNPIDPAQLADPMACYRELREHAPVQRTDIGTGTWIVSRYEDVKQLVRKTDGLMQPVGFTSPPELVGGPAESIYRGLMVLNDPPKHTRLRKLTERALTRPAVEDMRERVVQVVDEALDEVAEAGEMDAVDALAFLVPLRVISGMLGIPEADRQMLLDWTPDFFRIFIPAANDEAGIEACHRACQNYTDYLSEQIEYRRSRPGDDIFSALIQAEEEGDRLSREELISTVLSLLTGGFDTTMGMIGAGIYCFATQPDQLERLNADPAGMARPAVEEVLRWESPVGVTFRHFVDDIEVAGTTIPAGETVWLLLVSANHDETRFEAPDLIDIERPDNKHMAFGGARHFCIGSHLARLEGEVTFEQIGKRLRNLELTGEAPRRQNFQFRSFLELPVRFDMA